MPPHNVLSGCSVSLHPLLSDKTFAFTPQRSSEAISKLLKTVKEPSLRSATGSVFPPSHKATAGQAAVTIQVATLVTAQP